MLQPYPLSDIVMAISKDVESDVNTPYTGASDFEGILADQIAPYVPELSMIDDSTQVGDGTEFAKFPRPYAWNQTAVTFSSKLNTEFMARSLRRFLGGTVTDTLVTTGVYDHVIKMQLRTNRVPLLSTCAMELGGADFVLSSMAAEQFSIAQTGNAEPTGSVALVGSGHHQRIRDIVGGLTLPAPPTFHYMHGSALAAVLNNGSPLDLTSLGLLDFNITMNNNMTWRGLPGIDQFLTAGDVNSGAYMGLVYRGNRTCVPTVKLFMDADLDEYDWQKQNLDITGLKFTSKGQKIGATAYQHEFELTIPFSKLQRFVSDTDGNMSSRTWTFLPTKDPVSLGIVTARIRNGSATLT